MYIVHRILFDLERSEMTARLREPVINATELSLCAGVIPTNMKATTQWGIHVQNEWAASRTTSFTSRDRITPVTTSLIQTLDVDLAYWMEISKFFSD